MKALIESHGWVEVETWPEATFWLGEPTYFISDDPEAGSFTESDFEATET